MEEIFISLPGKPIAKKTHRDFCKVNWGSRSIKRWRHFPQSEEAKNIALQIKEQYRGEPLKCGVSLQFEFYMSMPVRWRKSQKDMARKGLLHHVIKPDASNLAKFYEDCMRGIVFEDDCQVVWVSPVKLFSDEPRTEIRVREFDYEKYAIFKALVG